MTATESGTIALIWAQYAAYHVDRCEAVAARLGTGRLAGRHTVLAVEVASTSRYYAWEPSGDTAGATKLTLFPDQPYDQVPALRRVLAIYRAVRRCDWVFIGLPYSGPDVILLSLLLRLSGVRLIVFSESKADDQPRKALTEWIKRVVLSVYHGAIVGAARHIAYFRGLGFRQRPVLPGYNGVNIDRVRAQAGQVLAPAGAPFAARPFVYVGRFVDKKNLPNLIDAYAAYTRAAGALARPLILAGSGPEEAEMRARIARGGVADLVSFPGFLSAEEVSRLLSGALALVLVSREEQWGLVVNEALALGLPVIASQQVGARDALVRHGENGWVVDSEDISAIAAALTSAAASEAQWQAMVTASHGRAWLGDTERLADAVEAMLCSAGSQPVGRMAEFTTAIAQQ